MTTYKIDRITDLLKVPAERRTDCLRELEYALCLHELAFGEDAANVEVGPMRWTDDGDRRITLHGASQEPMLTLQITDAEPAV